MTNYDGRAARINHASRRKKIGRKMDGREERKRRLDFVYPLVTSFHERLIRSAIETMSMLDQRPVDSLFNFALSLIVRSIQPIGQLFGNL